ncbi:MAG: hypothetical protein HY596_02505 [Candidatus Omnitrophica bacterium]|nr:hypothetical protein [Candidatus Omnitrophota bacterium]
MDVKVKGWLVVSLLLGTLGYALAEEITLTTYYPSPRGMYDELRTKGDVAIGKLDPPNARLEIRGKTAGTADKALYVGNLDGDPRLVVQNDGNVGIGMTNPTAKLEVAGQVKITGGAPGSNKVLMSDASGLASWQTLETVPAGAVMSFALASCPAGWSLYGAAQGRYIVGVPPGGAVGGIPLGTTPLSNLENRPVGQHAHGINDPGHAHAYLDRYTIPMNAGKGTGAGLSNQYIDDLARTTSASTTNITINNAGSFAGTNAPYVQLLVCRKD